METYKSVRKEGHAEIVEKRSRFLSHVYPMQSEQAALDTLEAVRQQYADATHNVFAYCLRAHGAARYSDDKEPAKSAGMPVLDVIRKSGLTDVLIVVTRYFGGTLLGVGGLVHAYTAAAKAGIEAAGVVTMRRCAVLSVAVPYPLYGKVKYAAESCGGVVEDVAYEADVTLRLRTLWENRDRLRQELIQATDAQARVAELPERYDCMDEAADLF